MNKGTVIFAFSIGAALGSVVTLKVVKNKYERIANEEIKSMKGYFDKKYNKYNVDDKDEPNPKTEEAIDSVDFDEYESTLTDLGYTSHEETEEQKGGMKSMNDKPNDKPYVIEPDEFGDIDEYETVSLTYYADKVLADEDNLVIHDVEEFVGYESLEHFGEYEEDSVFVRNDKHKTDYEILLDERKYAESRRRPYNPQVDD